MGFVLPGLTVIALTHDWDQWVCLADNMDYMLDVLRILLDQVAAGGSVGADPLDELQRRRREKATGA